jgi:hypothetical protein
MAPVKLRVRNIFQVPDIRGTQGVTRRACACRAEAQGGLFLELLSVLCSFWGVLSILGRIVKCYASGFVEMWMKCLMFY